MRKPFLSTISAFLLDRWQIWTHAPSTLGYRLVVDGIREIRLPSSCHASHVFGRRYRRRVPLPIYPHYPRPDISDEVRIIRLKAVRHDTREATLCQIAINLHTHRIDRAHTSSWLLGETHHRMYRVESLIVPVILAPIIKRIERSYREIEKDAHMSRHTWAIFEQIGIRLSDSTKALLVEAFRHQWKSTRATRARRTFP